MRTLLCAALLFAALPAAAEEAPRFSHYHQFGLGVTAGSGYRITFKYGSAYACRIDPPGMDAAATCYNFIPAWLDMKAFFGVSHHVDVVFEFRLGLQNDFYGSFPLALMPGIRYYPEASGRVKFYVQAQAYFDFSDPGSHPTGTLARYDIGVHEANGLQIEIARWVGVYIQISETLLFLRSLSFQIEGGGGLEARFP